MPTGNALLLLGLSPYRPSDLKNPRSNRQTKSVTLKADNATINDDQVHVDVGILNNPRLQF